MSPVTLKTICTARHTARRVTICFAFFDRLFPDPTCKKSRLQLDRAPNLDSRLAVAKHGPRSPAADTELPTPRQDQIPGRGRYRLPFDPASPERLPRYY